ncbi:hypothetical protein [uncultured Draconibacterium sp.]|uniref:hypothetical protein n=1 Tax=uncultured Draconibacterium sp. TaxID=1573823 RepID=UPI0032179E6D
MNLNLNFGEHFYEAGNSNLFYDLSITFISAFLGLLAALLVNRLIDTKKQKKEAKYELQKNISHLNYLSELLDSIIKNYPQQALNYKKLSELVKENPLEAHLADLRATYDLARLKDMDSYELRDAYFNLSSRDKNSLDKYRKIFANADFLLMYFDDLLQQNENHRNFTHKDQLFVRDCVEEISNRLGLKEKNIQKENPQNFQEITEYQYLHKFSLIFIELSQSIVDFKTWKEKYLRPLHDSILYELSDIDLADSIFSIIKRAVGRLRNIEFNSIEFANDMENVESKINNSIDILEKINNELKEKTSHNILQIP